MSALLYYTYGVVMLASLACFAQAYRHRFRTPLHKRWGMTGVILSLAGITVVIVMTYGFGEGVRERFPDVVLVHRVIAMFASTLMLFVAFTGMRRMRIHTKLYIVFLPLYVAAVVTALIGYGP